MLPGKHIIPNHHFTKQGQSSKGRKKPCLMHGMATIVSHYTPMIGTTLHSSPLGDDIDTAQPHKGTLPQVTATPDDMMKLSLPFQTKQNVLTIPADIIEESFFQAAHWLDICGRHGITLNPKKFRFAQNEVEFAGFEITNDTVRPCKKYLRAISDFPIPQSLTDVRSWFGLVNQVSYAFSMAETMLPFRELLKPNNQFKWNDALQQAFEKSKQTIIKEIHNGVQIFDKTQTHMFGHRLVKNWHWLLVVPETLHLPL